jgi:hypothetical protein
MINKKLEEAKGYFVLSQILIIFSGFLFASGGVSYGFVYTNFDKAVSFSSTSQNLSLEQINLTNSLRDIYGNLMINNLQLWVLFIYGGLFFVVSSFISWVIGMKKIRDM